MMNERSPALVDTLITGAILATMDAKRRVLKDGALAVTADRIVAVGKSAIWLRSVAPKMLSTAAGSW